MSDFPEINLFDGWRVFEWRNALTILKHAHGAEWQDIEKIVSDFRLKKSYLVAKGKGNKSAIASAIDSGFYSHGWKESRFHTAIVVDGNSTDSPTHAVDCFKGKVAIELEWNNKDPFYDRDLNNFRLLFDLRVVDVGVVITRTTELQQWLHSNRNMLGKSYSTYGGSTTHYDKLEPRILGGGAGGCPILVLGMTEDLYVDDT